MKQFGFPLRHSSRLLYLAPVFLLPILGGCLAKGGKASGPGEGGTAGVRLSLTPAALVRSDAPSAPVLDSVRIRITAEDMAPLEFSFAGDSLRIDLEGLPAGEDRLISAWLFRSGRLLYAGRGSFAFRRESRVDAALRCDPQFSRVTARFHLPSGMPAPIAGGLLKLTGSQGAFSAPLRLRDEFGSFLVDELPGDVRYDVAMSLSDSGGKVRYQADRSGVYLPLGEEAKWDMALLPSEAEAGVSLSLGAPKEAVVEAGFPSRLRKPARAGELILSEFYAAPAEKDSGSQGEWFEIFNRTADTLSLSGCRVSRDRSGGVTRSYAFDSSRAVGPGRAMVFGKPAAPADAHYADFSLVNTASSLLILCGGGGAAEILIDSLRYSSTAADSLAVPMREGKVSSLDAYGISRRASPQSWCLTRMGEGGAGDTALVASPGGMGACGE
jgi:hypothetical protein